VLDATPLLGRTPLLSASELRAAERSPIYANRQVVPGLNESSLRRWGRQISLAQVLAGSAELL
jgi:hypothetical protein